MKIDKERLRANIEKILVYAIANIEEVDVTSKKIMQGLESIIKAAEYTRGT